MATVSKQKDGRNWKVDNSGIKSLSREYVVILDAITGADGESYNFTGIPAIGSKHPTLSSLYVVNYDVREGSGKDKKTITVTVNYERQEIESHEGEHGETVIDSAIESWGWDASTATKELTQDHSAPDPKKVVNSAGDPFDKTPTVEGFAPTFTKVFKSPNRISGAQGCSCYVNSAAMTIGGMSCSPRTLLCAVAEEAIIGDEKWHFRYRVQFKYRPETWDVKIIQAGMRCKDPLDPNNLKLCTVIDKETGRVCRVTSPSLLDNQGYQVSPTDTSAPYIAEFRTYPERSFPSIFTSEPTIH